LGITFYKYSHLALAISACKTNVPEKHKLCHPPIQHPHHPNRFVSHFSTSTTTNPGKSSRILRQNFPHLRNGVKIICGLLDVIMVIIRSSVGGCEKYIRTQEYARERTNRTTQASYFRGCPTIQNHNKKEHGQDVISKNKHPISRNI
jgi:hypothetical protein